MAVAFNELDKIILDYLKDIKCQPTYPYKRWEKVYKKHTEEKAGNRPTETEVGVMWSQIKISWKPPEAKRGKSTLF